MDGTFANHIEKGLKNEQIDGNRSLQATLIHAHNWQKSFGLNSQDLQQETVLNEATQTH